MNITLQQGAKTLSVVCISLERGHGVEPWRNGTNLVGIIFIPTIVSSSENLTVPTTLHNLPSRSRAQNYFARDGSGGESGEGDIHLGLINLIPPAVAPVMYICPCIVN